jgi:hypothetical protein
MPLFKCKKCHHEWEGSKEHKCEWCGGEPIVLEEQTSMEKWLEELSKNKKLIKNIRSRWNELRERHRRNQIWL